MQLRFDPFRELERWTAQTSAGSPRHSIASNASIPMDAVRKGDHVEVRFDLPGFDPAQVELEVERNVLSLKAERQWEPADDETVVARERRHGSYSRKLFLGDNLDGGRVEANYDNGVLTVTIPVTETAKPKKVEIASTVPTDEIEAPAAAN